MKRILLLGLASAMLPALAWEFGGDVWMLRPGSSPKERVVFVCAHPDDLAGPSGTAILLARKFDVHVIDYNNRAGGGSTDSTQFHFANLVDCIRANAPEKAAANADIGTKSTMLALLGNISQTTGEAIRVDPATGRMLNRGAAENLWSREYAKSWEIG